MMKKLENIALTAIKANHIWSNNFAFSGNFGFQKLITKAVFRYMFPLFESDLL